MAHLPSSLDKLAKELRTESVSSFKALQDYVGQTWGGDSTKLDLLLRKGVFPYTWLDQPSKLEVSSLPPQPKFYNDLSEEPCSDEDYQHAHKVWDTFGMRSFREYTDIYVKTDVLLLVDVFNRYREECLEAYKLDSIHYFTCPALTWDAGLKFSNVRLELLTNVDQYMFCEAAIRGGVSTICHRHAEANNIYLPDTYDPQKPDRFLIYLDANNLYGQCMSRPLPEKNFHWKTDLTTDDIRNYDPNCGWGCLVQVDAEIPDELHDKLNDIPPCPDSLDIDHKMASSTTRRHRATRFGDAYVAPTQQKLAPNLFNKEGYIGHITAMKKWMELGVKITRIIKVLAFDQRPWLEPYIKFNTEKRMAADSDFKRSFYKLMVSCRSFHFNFTNI